MCLNVATCLCQPTSIAVVNGYIYRLYVSGWLEDEYGTVHHS